MTQGRRRYDVPPRRKPYEKCRRRVWQGLTALRTAADVVRDQLVKLQALGMVYAPVERLVCG